jgi:hypothetical protein
MAANLRSVATDSIDDLRPITTSEKRTDNLSAGDRFAGLFAISWALLHT